RSAASQWIDFAVRPRPDSDRRPDAREGPLLAGLARSARDRERRGNQNSQSTLGSSKKAIRSPCSIRLVAWRGLMDSLRTGRASLFRFMAIAAIVIVGAVAFVVAVLWA